MSENNVTRRPMTTERLDEIGARTRAATEGPWTAWDSGYGYHIGVGDLGEGGQPVRLLPARILPEGTRTDIGRRGDAEFIAAARRDVPDLLAEVERLRAELGDLRGQNAMTEANFTDYAEATHEENDALRKQIEEANASLRKLAEDKLTLQAGLFGLLERTAHLAGLVAGDVDCAPCRDHLDGCGAEPCDEYAAPSGPIKAALGVS